MGCPLLWNAVAALVLALLSKGKFSAATLTVCTPPLHARDLANTLVEVNTNDDVQGITCPRVTSSRQATALQFPNVGHSPAESSLMRSRLVQVRVSPSQPRDSERVTSGAC